MGTIADKLTYLNGTKQAIKEAINEDFQVIDNNTTFRKYAEKISNNNANYKALIPKTTVNGTDSIDINNAIFPNEKAFFTHYGNTEQDGTPTPDNPVDIVNISGKTTINIGNKNLFDKNTATYKDGYYIDDSGNEAANNSVGYTTSFVKVKPSTTYTISGQITRSAGYFRVYYYDNNKNFIERSGVYTPPPISFTPPNNCYYIRFVYQIDTFDADTVQIEEGSTNTSYTEHQEKNYDIDLPFDFCKIGTYKDKIYPNNGKWYLHKEIGDIVLDGSESWGYASNIFYTSSINNYLSRNNIPFSNYFTGKTNSATATVFYNLGNLIIGFNNSSSLPRLYIRYDDIITINDFKNWLSTHDTKVEYVLATPTDTEITSSNYPTLYNQLNAIKLFEGANHITLTNESGLDVEFDVEYYKDWRIS